MVLRRNALMLLLIILLAGNLWAQQCPFNAADANSLARCLIRPVRINGNVGPTPAELPNVLKDLIGKPVNVDITKLRKHLTDNGISEAGIGGTITQDLARVRFFVIHDTSSPEISGANFPADINETTWSGNRLSVWVSTNTPTHVFVNRVGESATKANFNTLVRATKYEAGKDIANATLRQQARQSRGGLFIHFELIQPRRKAGSFFNLGPTPGFTQKQLDRLALLYIVASFRSNKWLLPAFHASVDATIADAHDDPQNFDLPMWLNSVSTLLNKVKP